MQSVMARDPEEFARRRRDCPCGNRCRSRTADTVKIGFRPLTGPLASNGKAILTAYQMWQEDINAKGDLPVARAEEFRYPAEELQNAARSNAVEAAS